MNASALSERVGSTQQVEAHDGCRGPDSADGGPRFNEPTPPWYAVRTNVHDERSFESLVGGAGI